MTVLQQRPPVVANTTEPERDQAAAPSPRRRVDFDVLRVAVVAGLVFLHTANIWQQYAQDFDNRQGAPNPGLALGQFWGSLWGMPVLFVVAGAACWYSLRSRPVRLFVRERLTRIGIPLVVGLLTVVPLQKWLWNRRTEGLTDSFPAYWAQLLDLRPAWDFPYLWRRPTEPWDADHLWFLYMLVVYTLMLLPLLLWLRRARQARAVRHLAGWMTGPRIVLLPAIPIAIIEMVSSLDVTGGWSRFVYLPLLLYGFVFAADHRFIDTMARSLVPAAIAGTVGFGLTLAIGYFLAQAGRDPVADHDAVGLTWRFTQGIVGWTWTVVILGLAYRLFNGGEPGPRFQKTLVYANRAVLPYYILHQLAITVIAVWVLTLPLPGIVMYFLIALGAAGLTLLAYDLVIKRNRVMGLLFGAGPRPPLTGRRSWR